MKETLKANQPTREQVIPNARGVNEVGNQNQEGIRELINQIHPPRQGNWQNAHQELDSSSEEGRFFT